MRIWRDWRVALKLTVSISGLVLLTVAGVTTASIVRETALMERELRQQASLVLDMLEAVTINALYRLDVATDRVARLAF